MSCFIRARLRLCATFSAQNNNVLLENMSRDKAFQFTRKQLENAREVSFFRKQEACICGDGYPVLENFASQEIGLGPHCDTYHIDKDSQKTILDTQDSFPFHTLDGKVTSVCTTFQKQVLHPMKKSCTLYAPITNYGTAGVDDVRTQATRYFCTRFYLMKYFQWDLAPVWTVFIMWITEIRGEGGVTGTDFEAQIGHKDVPVRVSTFAGYFMLANGNEEGKLYVCKASRHFVIYHPEDKRKMKDTLKIDPVLLLSTAYL